MDNIDKIVEMRAMKARRQAFEEAKLAEEIKSKEREERRSILEDYDNRQNDYVFRKKLSEFNDRVYKTLLTETFTQLALTATFSLNEKDKKSKRAIIENMMKSYLEDRDAKEMRRTFAATSQFLAEVNMVCDKYADIITETSKEKCKGKKAKDINDSDIFNIEEPTRDDFYKEIDAINADELSYTIRNRVMDATQTFIDSYNRDKAELKGILKDTNDTINFLKEDSNLKDYYANKSRIKMKAVTNKHITGVYESMVLGFSKSCYNNQELGNVFITEGTNLDTDAIREHCELLYTVLETLNTAKIERHPEEFLAKQIKDISNI